ncbi:MAG: tyrosine-type recombinase/integrase, partial [Gemmatimonadetes bacterium]|nr:tyrosine-type recombinase/integrase [Gemmatimonadota bacterium]
SRIYTRTYPGGARFWADFRDFSDVGGDRERLIAPGERFATTDHNVAEVLAGRRLQELEALRHGHAIHGTVKQTSLGAFASEHLLAKKRSGRFADETIAAHELYLQRALDFFGVERELGTITVAEVRDWLTHLQTVPNQRGGTLSAWSARHHLGALSNLYRRAASEGYVPPGFNPASAIMEKPRMPHHEARWLEIHEAALLLEAARTYRSPRADSALPHAYELLATFLLTGGRAAEVFGLEVEDVSFDRKTLTFRPNEWRGLKTEASRRTIRLVPQLEEILRPYVFGANGPPGRLLFPSERTAIRAHREGMIRDVRKVLDAIAARAGWQPGEIRTKVFRHTYTAARLQTLDHGAPVSIYTVSRELGHGSTSMVQKVYSHLGAVRHRGEFVEYRVEQHLEELKGRLAGLRMGR